VVAHAKATLNRKVAQNSEIKLPVPIEICGDGERELRLVLEANPGWEICGDAVDGREAIAKATELRPDLIILDYAMPRLDGLSAAKEIHKLLPTVPIVLHTLYESTEVELAANNYGIRRVVGKAKPGALISAVEELLSTEAASQPDAASDETAEILAPPIANPTPYVAPSRREHQR